MLSLPQPKHRESCKKKTTKKSKRIRPPEARPARFLWDVNIAARRKTNRKSLRNLSRGSARKKITASGRKQSAAFGLRPLRMCADCPAANTHNFLQLAQLLRVIMHLKNPFITRSGNYRGIPMKRQMHKNLFYIRSRPAIKCSVWQLDNTTNSISIGSCNI